MGSTGRDGSERATQATASASASRSTMIRIPCCLHPACATLRGGPHAYSHGALTFPCGRRSQDRGTCPPQGGSKGSGGIVPPRSGGGSRGSSPRLAEPGRGGVQGGLDGL